MYVHFGKRPYGKCDVVPELFYVATFFFHINFVPLVPLGSYIILGQSAGKYQAVKIPFSIKSVLYAWLRVLFFATAAVGWIFVFVSLAEAGGPDIMELETSIVVGVLATAAYLFVMIYPRVRQPGYPRACELAHYARLNERGWAALNVLHGRDPFDRPEPPAIPGR